MTTRTTEQARHVVSVATEDEARDLNSQRASSFLSTSGPRYERRKAALAMIGFVSYDEYLASDLWKAIRTRILERDGHRCVLCGKKAYTAHHATYHQYVLQGNNDTQLMSVCRGCHRRIEFDGDVKLLTANGIAKKAKRVNKKASKRHKPECVVCHFQKKLGRDDICMDCYRSGRALKWRQSNPKSVTVNRLTQNRANRLAGSPAAGTERCDASYRIPDQLNGVSSREGPDHPLLPAVAQGTSD